MAAALLSLGDEFGEKEKTRAEEVRAREGRDEENAASAT
jgi:hypothetical protein